MTIPLQQLALLFVSLFTLFSPLANIGPFSSLMSHLSRSDQKKLAFGVFINALVIMLLFVWVGELLFSVLGINSPSLSIAGGIALIVAGIPMMLGINNHDKDIDPEEEKKTWREMATVPMTFPMSIGGTTTGYLVTASGLSKNIIDLLAISVVVLLFAGVIWLTHFFSPPLASKFSPQVRLILNRVSGIILVAIAIQLFANGAKGFFPVLAG